MLFASQSITLHIIWSNFTPHFGPIGSNVVVLKHKVGPSLCRVAWGLCGPLQSGSLVQLVAVVASGPIVALAELSDPPARLDHHRLRHRHNDAEEVWILKCLKEGRTWTLLAY